MSQMQPNIETSSDSICASIPDILVAVAIFHIPGVKVALADMSFHSVYAVPT